MTTAFSQEVIDEIKHRQDIVEIIGGYVQLKKRGRNYIGLCPFHSEKTPSFTVSQDKQIFYCFGCGVGGDVLSFLMKINGYSFAEAVTTLAVRAGISLAENVETPVDRRQREFKERLYQLGAIAASFYYRIITSHPVGAGARTYLTGRGIKEETIRAFNLGFAPDKPDALSNYLCKKGFQPEEIEKAGLAVLRKPRGLVDRFRNRVMFPIRDSRGRVVGFGGRIMGEGEPKYLNTPETVLFSKGKNLFGLDLALQGIRREKQAVLVEGYMDMIAAWQHGIDYVVATLGTALTREQARELKRHAGEVIISFDADKAGVKAALRGLDVLTAAGLQVRVLELPEGSDPDSFLNSQGKDAFTALMKSSPGLMEYRIKRAIFEHDVTTARGKQEAVAELLPYLGQLKDAVEQEVYVRLLSRHTGVSETSIINDIRSVNTKQDKAEKTSHKVRHGETGELTGGGELFLLRAYISSTRLAELVDYELGKDWGCSPVTRNLLEVIRSRRDIKPDLADKELLQEITREGEGISTLAARVALADDMGPVNEQSVKKSMKLYKLQQLKTQEKDLLLSLSRAENNGDTGQVQKLQKEIFQLQQKICSLT